MALLKAAALSALPLGSALYGVAVTSMPLQADCCKPLPGSLAAAQLAKQLASKVAVSTGRALLWLSILTIEEAKALQGCRGFPEGAVATSNPPVAFDVLELMPQARVAGGGGVLARCGRTPGCLSFEVGVCV